MQVRNGCVALLTALLVGVLATPGLTAEPGHDWPQFLGPQRTGISAEKNLLEAWPAGGPKEVWRAKGGVGMAGLAVSRGRLLTLVQREGKQWLVAHDAKTGAPVWQSALAPEYRNSMGDGPRATPTVAGDLVLTFTGEGILTASKFQDGKPVWSHDCVKEHKGKVAEYGMACSPLVAGELVIVNVGAPGGPCEGDLYLP